MVPTKCCYIEVLVEGFSGVNSTKNSISMSFVREKVSRSSDESQETRLLSVVESAKPSDESQGTKLLSVVGSPKPSDESQEAKLLSVVGPAKPSDKSQETKSLSVVELRKENDLKENYPRGRLLPRESY